MPNAEERSDFMAWTDFYKSEEALISDMMRTKSDETKYNSARLVKGYEYINGFKQYYSLHGCLTPKQMTQLKRLVSINTRNQSQRIMTRQKII